MRLINNWKPVAARSHSMWAFYLSVICLITPEIVYFGFGVDTNPRFWWLSGLVLLIWGIIGRLKDQGIDRSKMQSPWAIALFAVAIVVGISFGNLREPVQGDGSIVSAAEASDLVSAQTTGAMPVSDAEFSQLAVPFIGRWEGLRLDAYQDIIGVWTVCYGETKGVKPADRYSKAECDAMFAHEVLSYRKDLHRYFSSETLNQRLPAARDVAYTSLAYNAGVAGIGRSTATRRLNAGDIIGGCNALTWWNKAGGRVIRGLVNRRTEEQQLCLRGVG